MIPLANSKHQRAGVLAFLGFSAAQVLTVAALFFGLVTFATKDYKPILARALACAGGAIVLIVFCWRSMPVIARVIGVLVILADLWVISNALARLGLI